MSWLVEADFQQLQELEVGCSKSKECVEEVRRRAPGLGSPIPIPDFRLSAILFCLAPDLGELEHALGEMAEETRHVRKMFMDSQTRGDFERWDLKRLISDPQMRWAVHASQVVGHREEISRRELITRLVQRGKLSAWYEAVALLKPGEFAIVKISNNPPRFVVLLRGIDGVSASHSQDMMGAARDFLSGRGLYTQRVREAIERTVPKGSQLILAGHSQGGIVANRLVPHLRSAYTVSHVISAGSPVDHIDTYAGTKYVSIVEKQDPVTGLDSAYDHLAGSADELVDILDGRSTGSRTEVSFDSDSSFGLGGVAGTGWAGPGEDPLNSPLGTGFSGHDTLKTYAPHIAKLETSNSYMSALNEELGGLVQEDAEAKLFQATENPDDLAGGADG